MSKSKEEVQIHFEVSLPSASYSFGDVSALSGQMSVLAMDHNLDDPNRLTNLFYYYVVTAVMFKRMVDAGIRPVPANKIFKALSEQLTKGPTELTIKHPEFRAVIALSSEGATGYYEPTNRKP